jgi:Rieske Fe-S protein
VLKTDEAFPLAEEQERALERRRFLGLAGCAAVLVAAGEWAGWRLGTAARPPLEVTVDAASLAPGEALAVGGALAVKLAGGEVVAFDRRCPHLGCPVLWAAARERFECPCHEAAFEARTGRVLFGPPRRGLERAIVRLAGRAGERREL